MTAGRLAVVVVLALLGGAASGQEARATADAVLAELSKRLGAVKTLRARFEQKKHLEVFEEDVVSEGTLALAAPDRLRWEYVKPLKSSLVVNGKRAMREKTSRKGETTRTVFALEDEPITAITAEQVFLWTRGDFAKARESYELALRSDKPLVVVATPRNERVREVVSAVELTFADDRSSLAGVTLVEKSGAKTFVTFHDMELDPALPDALFRVER